LSQHYLECDAGFRRVTSCEEQFGYSGYISEAVRLVKLPSENPVSELANAGIPSYTAHITSSLPRLFLHVMPAAWLAIGLALSPPKAQTETLESKLV
jgi:hypothetical protein